MKCPFGVEEMGDTMRLFLQSLLVLPMFTSALLEKTVGDTGIPNVSVSFCFEKAVRKSAVLLAQLSCWLGRGTAASISRCNDGCIWGQFVTVLHLKSLLSVFCVSGG